MENKKVELDTYETCLDNFGTKHFTITASERWSIKLVTKLLKEHPEEVELVAKNPDGSMLVRVPKKYVKISAPRKVSEEQREAFKQRMHGTGTNA